MRSLSRSLAAVAALGTLATTTLARPAAATSYDLPGSDVAIYDLVGTVKVEPGTGPHVTVDVTPVGRDAAKLKVETGELGGRQTLRVVFPLDDIVDPGLGRWSGSDIAVREDGRFDDTSMRGLAAIFRRHVHIKGSGSGTEAHADLVVRVPRGLKVSLYNGVGRMSADGVDADVLLDGSATAVETHGTKGALKVDVGSGEVSVENADGLTLVDTGSGNVRVSQVSGDSIKLDTGSGEVSGSSVRARALNVDTGSGSVRLAAVDAPEFLCDTGSGSVAVTLLGSPYRIRVDTGSGSVDLGLPASTGARLHADTGSGDVQCDLPITRTHRDSGSLSGVLGDGRGTIRLDTGSGSIHLHAGSAPTHVAE